MYDLEGAKPEMKDLIKNIFLKIKDSGTEKIDASHLKDNSWFFINEDILVKKVVYIFRANGELLISKNGDITKAKWENLIHSTTSIIMEINGKTTLYNIIYLTSEYLVIQKDGTEEIKVFIKQQRYLSNLPSEKDKNPVEMVFKDLNRLLNQRNLKSADKTSLERGRKSPVLIGESSKKREYVKEKEDSKEILNSEEVYTPDTNEKFEYFNLLDDLEKIRQQKGGLTKDEEIDAIIRLQEKESELIGLDKICMHCKAINSIKNNVCRACGKKK